MSASAPINSGTASVDLVSLPVIVDTRPVFSTAWFQLIEKTISGYDDPFYTLVASDYVAIVATTDDNRLILVRQYRHSVEGVTVELPCGHVDDGQTPEEAARKELLEETGYVAQTVIPLGALDPDTGRYGNRMWCFFAPNAIRVADREFVPEPGIDVEHCECSVESLLNCPQFASALNVAAITLAAVKGFVPLRAKIDHGPSSLPRDHVG